MGLVEALDEAGARLALGGPTQAALLAVLALEAPGLVETDRIALDLWTDRAPRDPDAALQVAVSRLRKSLGSDLIETVRSGYRLALGPENVDVERFRRHSSRARHHLLGGDPSRAGEGFRRALAQWRGSALADLRRYEFAVRAAAVLEEERMATVETLMEAELAVGSHGLVVGELAGLVDEYPLRERLWALYMLALYRAGRQAEALRAFARVRSILSEELGVDPSTDLMELEERILQQDPGLDVEAAAGPGQDVDGGDMVAFGKGETIIEEGALSDSVYWIEDGEVEIFRSTPDGEEHLAILGPGRYFGELAGLLGIRRTASARSLSPVSLSVHTIDGFRRKLAQQ